MKRLSLFVAVLVLILLDNQNASAGWLFNRRKCCTQAQPVRACAPQPVTHTVYSVPSVAAPLSIAPVQASVPAPQPVTFPTPIRSGFYNLTGYPLGGCAGGQCPTPR